MNKIGIRNEDKYAAERRVPLIPEHVKKLVDQENLQIYVEKSPKRVFTHEEYLKAGAKLSNNLSDCNIILGVKEIPEEAFEPGKTYVFFSHVIKGQHYNMPMLKRMMELKCNLIDYEKIEDEMGRRLIFFGRHAGLAGMINTLWSVGQRLISMGIKNPFEILKQARNYNSLSDAKNDISRVGFEIVNNGLPAELTPFKVGVTGYGNVSNGAQEILNLLPVKEISPDELLSLNDRDNLPRNILFKTVFKEEHLAENIKKKHSFDLNDYYKNPHNYKSIFNKYVDKLSVLVNGMYWDSRYPKLITKDKLKELYEYTAHKLIVIGDITCDVDGSIESTVKAAPVEDPVFVYNPKTEEISSGFHGYGLLMMTVDILPTELPRESSIAFSNALYPYIKGLAEANFDLPYEDLKMPSPLLRGMILHKGELTPVYKYIKEYLKRND